MISLKMPADIRQYVLQFQGKMKAMKGLGNYSQQKAILSIIREHQQFTDEPPNNPKEQESQQEIKET